MTWLNPERKKKQKKYRFPLKKLKLYVFSPLKVKGAYGTGSSDSIDLCDFPRIFCDFNGTDLMGNWTKFRWFDSEGHLTQYFPLKVTTWIRRCDYAALLSPSPSPLYDYTRVVVEHCYKHFSYIFIVGLWV